MGFIDWLKKQWSDRKRSRKRQKDIAKARQELLTELEGKIELSEKQLKELEEKKTALEEAMKLGTDSTEDTRKKSAVDKIRKIRTEIVVHKAGRDISYRAETDGYFIRWREGRYKKDAIIATRPREFETEMIPWLWYRRGFRYYIKHGEKTTHYPNIGVSLPQIKYAVELTDAVTKAETYKEMAKATKGTDRKQLMMWLIAIVIIAIAGIAGAGQYFK